MKTTTLTKEEFIVRSMAGDRFMHDGNLSYYDDSKFTIPFRINSIAMEQVWRHMDGKTIFEIVEPEPKIERRWKWRRDFGGYTQELQYYYTDDFAKKDKITEKGYYKVEDCYIDVEVK